MWSILAVIYYLKPFLYKHLKNITIKGGVHLQNKYRYKIFVQLYVHLQCSLLFAQISGDNYCTLQNQHPAWDKRRQKVALETHWKASSLIKNWTDCNYNSYCHSHYCRREREGGWACMCSVSRALMRLYVTIVEITASQCGDVTHLTCTISPLRREGGAQKNQKSSLH